MDKLKRGMTDSMKNSVEQNFKKMQKANKAKTTIQSRLETALERLENIQTQLRDLSQFNQQKETKSLIKQISNNIQDLKSYLAEQQTNQVMVMGNKEANLESTGFILQNCVVQMLIQNPFHQKERNEVKKFYENRDKTKLYQIDNGTLDEILETVGKFWNFNVFLVEKMTQQNSLEVIGSYLLQKYFAEKYQLSNQKINKYSIIQNYNSNPYHNSQHAADVTHTSLYFVWKPEKLHIMDISDLFALVIATMNHDVGHKALNNRFLLLHVNNHIDNDISTLENMHASLCFKLLQQTKFLKHVSDQDYEYIRKLIIELILHTDMSRHFNILSNFRAKFLHNSNIDIHQNKLEILQMVLKASDIGHSAKD